MRQVHAIATSTGGNRVPVPYHRQAWRAADPYLEETLLAIACNGPMTLERQALVAVARNDEAEVQRLVAVLIRRNQLGLRLIE